MADIVEYIKYAWNQLNPITIRNCFKKCGTSEQSYAIEVSDLENDLQAEVVKMGKEIGIIVVETLTGEQDENMHDNWEAYILCEIENYEKKYGIDTYENEECLGTQEYDMI